MDGVASPIKMIAKSQVLRVPVFFQTHERAALMQLVHQRWSASNFKDQLPCCLGAVKAVSASAAHGRSASKSMKHNRVTPLVHRLCLQISESEPRDRLSLLTDGWKSPGAKSPAVLQAHWPALAHEDNSTANVNLPVSRFLPLSIAGSNAQSTQKMQEGPMDSVARMVRCFRAINADRKAEKEYQGESVGKTRIHVIASHSISKLSRGPLPKKFSETPSDFYITVE
ncbi:hypothetical protein PGTUg99_034306 [Puccinia graminis f. sp. tritici]|uniref:Uncharacterized protein n=1 Tax=Puccinia graminis f. sp. tritici TaxID=56615 RepID=A0A5B0RBR9_PUCGR|nr:hypothetical protein PGTUg99_034306 [Puccinia graminis f. sp. tritici]